MNHDWPANQEHFWSKWMNKDRKTKYRVCLHPDCSAVEDLDVSKG